MSEEYMNVKVKHVIEYLKTLDPEASIYPDHDGWMTHEIKPKDEVDLVRQRGIFQPYKAGCGTNCVCINN